MLIVPLQSSLSVDRTSSFIAPGPRPRTRATSTAHQPLQSADHSTPSASASLPTPASISSFYDEPLTPAKSNKRARTTRTGSATAPSADVDTDAVDGDDTTGDFNRSAIDKFQIALEQLDLSDSDDSDDDFDVDSDDDSDDDSADDGMLTPSLFHGARA